MKAIALSLALFITMLAAPACADGFESVRNLPPLSSVPEGQSFRLCRDTGYGPYEREECVLLRKECGATDAETYCRWVRLGGGYPAYEEGDDQTLGIIGGAILGGMLGEALEPRHHHCCRGYGYGPYRGGYGPYGYRGRGR
ncbi:MAG: hypothetical protein KGI41_04260 [Patescibacteria group bacterium]|nr:hypothetical protein [Patescibacteria group bacterium]MDE1966424.1 hypothetical protein [Patescibacteria group bacterium]